MSLLTGQILSQNWLKSCIFPRGLFCADHFGAVNLNYQTLLRLIFIHVESIYFSFFVKMFEINK